MRLDLTSHICWHVFGLIQKGEKNYEEALKSYTQALRFDKDNLNILRDAAQLQTQLRLFDSLVETRYALLRLRPNLRQNWIALAVAYHLNGNLTEAKKIVDHYQFFLKNLLDYDVEQSEILLYHVRILEELGDFKEALSLLDKKAKERAIVDRTAIMEARARILQRLENDEAKNAWHNLIERNPDCYAYYRGYLSCQIDHDQSAALQMLQPFLSQVSNARAPWRFALDIAVGNDFEELVKPYLISSLEKGIPSLFADIKSLYKDESKRQTIASIGEELITQHTEPASKSAEPTTYLWTLYLMAQHHSYLGQHEQALTTLDTALTHTPTLPELHMFKARVLKRSGDPLGAARSMNDARLLDGQDRFLNTKCGKYLLRAGMVDEAESIFGLFTKKDASSPAADLEDMQSLLFLSELADCYHRCGKLNLALKKYMAIQKVFNEYEDDQYDFHGYNLRKFTINVYLNLLKWENQLKSHPVYVRSVLKTVQISVAVHDMPSLADPASQAPRLSDEEKKAKKKAKKAAQKTQDEAKKGMLGSQTSHEDRGLDAPPPKDDDPDGYKLLKSPDILDRAAKLLDPLLTGVQDNIDIWFALYDVSIRRRKLLQAARALQNAQQLDSSHPDIHFRIVHFKSTISSLPQLSQEPVGSIISETLNLIIPDTVSPETYNSQYLQKYPSSATSILSVAKVAAQILQAPQGEVEKIAFGALSEGVLLDIQTAQDILAFLRSISSQRFDDFRNACDAKFPLSTVFKAAEEQARYRQQVLVAGIQETPEVDGTSGSAADAEKS